MIKLKSLVVKIVFVGVVVIVIQLFSYVIDGMLLEYGIGNNIQLVCIGVQFNWGLNWNFWQFNGIYIGGYWDLLLVNWCMNYYNNINDSGNLIDLGLILVLCFQCDDGKGFYGEVGIGVYLFFKFYCNNDKVLLIVFQFGDYIGVGYVFSNGLDLGICLQYFFNGGIK